MSRSPFGRTGRVGAFERGLCPRETWPYAARRRRATFAGTRPLRSGRRALFLTAGAFLLAAAPRLARLLAAFLLALDLLAPGFRPALQAPATSEVSIGSGVATLVRPNSPPCGGLVLVHGLSRWGPAHPFFQRMARALARAGFAVLAPDLPHLRAFQMAESDVHVVVEAIKALENTAPGPLGILGFSFGAGPALLAAADPEIRDRVALIGTFGGYWDLAHVIVFITTGWYEEDGQWRRGRQQEYNRWKLLAALTPYIADPEEQRRLQKLVELKLADPDADVNREASRLGGSGRKLLALVENRERERIPALLDSLPQTIKDWVRRLSPANRIGEVRARLLIAHGAQDDSIPYTESVRLAQAAPNPGRLVIFEGLAHGFPSAVSRGFHEAREELRLVGLLDDLLELCRRG